ncbi:hypothetical protein BU25DRAFT_225183 [Macroventuria anomochaeta]|uniref:Uncharacterized protein n=1 Tax=Macroventuria anomochaeta TaxID=301207 RepID=A0ACB6SAA2_9PLEO|nr:uncharacterized protein BU25DRAFT_225183 [Macroventuria anomochaeta]KAF2631156.1 hypothetical protein BU25DRAFT_225183 [Macroventuria anomochaeta]
MAIWMFCRHLRTKNSAWLSLRAPMWCYLSKEKLVMLHHSRQGMKGAEACIFPLGGSYGLLQRTNIYAVLLLVVYYRHKTLLVKGAAGAVMVSSGVTAIHTIALACLTAKHRAVFDTGRRQHLGYTRDYNNTTFVVHAVVRCAAKIQGETNISMLGYR